MTNINETACGYVDLFRADKLTFKQVQQICDSHGLYIAEYMLDTAKEIRRLDGENSLTLWYNRIHRIIENGESDALCTAGHLSDWLGY